jgi:hypothetical protein
MREAAKDMSSNNGDAPPQPSRCNPRVHRAPRAASATRILCLAPVQIGNVKLRFGLHEHTPDAHTHVRSQAHSASLTAARTRSDAKAPRRRLAHPPIARVTSYHVGVCRQLSVLCELKSSERTHSQLQSVGHIVWRDPEDDSKEHCRRAEPYVCLFPGGALSNLLRSSRTNSVFGDFDRTCASRYAYALFRKVLLGTSTPRYCGGDG